MLLPKKALWVPPPLAFGSISMNRYHQELRSIADRLSSRESGFEVQSLDEPLITFPKRGTLLARVHQRYWSVPARCARMKDVSIFHALAHDGGELLKWAPRAAKKVITVHDLIPLQRDEGLGAKQLKRFRSQIESLSPVDAAVCVSAYTAQMLAEYSGLPEDRIHVNHNGVDYARFAALQPFPGKKNSPYVLSVSNASPRKNLAVLPGVFQVLKETHPDLKLLRVGSAFPDEVVAEWDKKVGREHLIEVGNCSDEDLVAYYQHAEAFFFPSLAEGFGLPLLEAMAARCPVACSNGTSLPEVGGDLAFYFDPNDSEAAADSLRVAMAHRHNENFLEKAGTYAATFTWERHLKNFFEIYQLVS